MSRIYEALKKAEQEKVASQESLSQRAYASPVTDPRANRNLVSTFIALSDALRQQPRES